MDLNSRGETGIGLRLSRRYEISDIEGTFQPMGLPNRVEWVVGKAVYRRLEALHAEVTVALEAGRRQVPLTHGTPCLLDVPDECTMSVSLDIGGPPRPRGASPIVRRLDAAFDPPLVFLNIVHTLVEVRKIFKDRGFSAARDRMVSSLDTLGLDGGSLAGRVAREVLLATWGGVPGRLDRHAHVVLRRVRGRPVWRNGSWWLALDFSGQVRVLDALPVPFYHVRLPGFIVPYPSASVESILSGSPFASADVSVDQIPIQHLARHLLDPIARATVQFDARGGFPPLDIQMETVLRSLVRVHSEPLDAFELTGSLSGGRKNGRFVFATKDLELKLDDNVVRARVAGDVSPDTLLQSIFEKPEEPGLDGAEQGRSSPPDNPPPSPPVSKDPPSRRADRGEPPNAVRLQVHVAPGSSIPGLNADIVITHPLAKGRIRVPIRLQELAVSGTGGMVVTADGHIEPRGVQVDLSLSVDILSEVSGGTREEQWTPVVERGVFRGKLTWDEDAVPKLTLDGEANFALTGISPLGTIPELSIEEGELHTEIAGTMVLHVVLRAGTNADGLGAIEIEGTTGHIDLARCRISASGRTLTFPEHAIIGCRVRHGELATSGLGKLAVDVVWNLNGASPVLRHPRGEVALFVDALRQGDFTVTLSPAGGLSIEGAPRGLYDARFFNALINPQKEPERLLEILGNDEAMGRVLATLDAFSPELRTWVERIRTAVETARKRLAEEGVTEPKHVIPRADMARVISRLLCGSHALADRLVPIIERVTEGGGLDRLAVKRIVNELYPDHLYDFELDRVLRWADHLLSPWDPLPPWKAQAVLPLAEDPVYLAQLASLPSAGDIYAVLAGEQPMPEGFPARVARFASYLTLEQLDYILAHAGEDWPPRDRARLTLVREVKRRTRMISEQYGGVEHIPQAMAIAFFLGDIIAPGDTGLLQSGAPRRPDARLDAICSWDQIAGPEDVAILLQAGLALPLEDIVVQINQRLLLDYIAARPPSFLLEVFVEMSRNSPRVLAGILMAFLEQNQSHMAHPIDLPAFCGERLGIDVPRRQDYMAGGRRARASYFQAVFEVAEHVLRNASPYLARRDRIQVRRMAPLPPLAAVSPSVARLLDEARKAIARADVLGRRCRFKGRPRGPHIRAIKAYQRAFEACARALEAEPRAFQLDWFKAFWKRNHEALVVLSVVRNYQEDVDRVRNWVHVRSGRDTFRGEQYLLDTVIDVLYHFEADRTALKSDPLVRLLIDPPEGRYDFTIVSCMGIVTEGAEGTELEETFQRLEAKRGIKTIRADTPTMRSLEFNAIRVEEAIRQVRTPWGVVGYSQGCANALMAESRLMGGTPDQHRLLDGFRCRNLLFGAHNGSAHGTCSNEKFRRAMIEGEYFLKHYQALFSSWAIDLFLRGLRLALDQKAFVLGLSGVESVSHEVCVALARDGQFLGHVPTSTVRGVVTPDILPEALEFLSHVLTIQVNGARHDTQVTLDASVGYPNLVINDYTRLLERCDMDSAPQVSHHWSPLLKETAFITTPRDIARAIYDFPKDRHIVPWIEVNARFGVIKRVD